MPGLQFHLGKQLHFSMFHECAPFWRNYVVSEKQCFQTPKTVVIF